MIFLQGEKIENNFIVGVEPCLKAADKRILSKHSYMCLKKLVYTFGVASATCEIINDNQCPSASGSLWPRHNNARGSRIALPSR